MSSLEVLYIDQNSISGIVPTTLENFMQFAVTQFGTEQYQCGHDREITAVFMEQLA
jgi:hypothetical protein